MGAALLQHPARVSDGLGDRDLVGEEGEVDEHQRAPRAPPDGRPVIDHLVEGRAEGRLVPRQHLIEGVAHEQDVYVGLLEQAGERRVVAGEHHDPAARRLHGQQVGHREGTRVSAHGLAAPPALAARSLGVPARDGE